MTSAPDIGFDYHPSRWPRAGLLAVGALALAAVWLSGLGWMPALVASVLIVLYVGVCVRALRRVPVRSVLWRTDGGWQLLLHGDRQVEARLAGYRTLAGGVILRLAWARRQRALLLLFGDNLDADTRRRLRMRLSASSDSH